MKHALALLSAISLAACTAQQQNNAQSSAQQAASAAPVVAKDAYLVTAVSAKLATVDVDSASSVRVAANHGVVTLTGQAHDSPERLRYEQAAASVTGVGSVRNQLTVAQFDGLRSQAADAKVTAQVSAAIAAQAGANVFHVTPSVHNGTVTLNGSVSERSVKETILRDVRKIDGVRAVIDHIAIHP